MTRPIASRTSECSVAPDDELVVSRLRAPLHGVSRLDVVAVSPQHAGPQRRHDVPFDAASDELLLAPRVPLLRPLPATRVVLRLIAVDTDGERVLGDYTLDHPPWPA